MENSPFSRLAPELRNVIWEYALTLPMPIFLDPQGHKFEHLNDEPDLDLFARDTSADITRKHSLALTHTCKQISSECGRLFYMHNSFQVHSSTLRKAAPITTASQASRALQKFATAIGRDNAASLQGVTIDIGAIDHEHGLEYWDVAEVLRGLRRVAMLVPHWNLKAVFHMEFEDRLAGRTARITCVVRLDDVVSSFVNELKQFGVNIARLQLSTGDSRLAELVDKYKTLLMRCQDALHCQDAMAHQRLLVDE